LSHQWIDDLTKLRRKEKNVSMFSYSFVLITNAVPTKQKNTYIRVRQGCLCYFIFSSKSRM